MQRVDIPLVLFLSVHTISQAMSDVVHAAMNPLAEPTLVLLIVTRLISRSLASVLPAQLSASVGYTLQAVGAALFR